MSLSETYTDHLKKHDQSFFSSPVYKLMFSFHTFKLSQNLLLLWLVCPLIDTLSNRQTESTGDILSPQNNFSKMFLMWIHQIPAPCWQPSRNMADKHIQGDADIFFCSCCSTPALRDCDFVWRLRITVSFSYLTAFMSRDHITVVWCMKQREMSVTTSALCYWKDLSCASSACSASRL